MLFFQILYINIYFFTYLLYIIILYIHNNMMAIKNFDSSQTKIWYKYSYSIQLKKNLHSVDKHGFFFNIIDYLVIFTNHNNYLITNRPYIWIMKNMEITKFWKKNILSGSILSKKTGTYLSSKCVCVRASAREKY